MIPKKIHYCWFGPKPLPKLVLKCLATWKETLPDYELCLWNEQNSPMHINFAKQAYELKKYAFVSDYVRFWALYNEGGIYLDTDMFVLKSFDPLLLNKVFFAWETNEKAHISCGVIGAIPKQAFIEKVKLFYENTDFKVSLIPELVVPKIVNSCFKDHNKQSDLLIYPFDYFYAFPYEEKENVKRFISYKTSNSYAIHLWNISWGTWQAKLKDKLLFHLKKLIR
jgi:mannosyltransferase OCH1-like enzyme